MKKKNGMMMHYKGEKIDLKIETKLRITFILFVVFSFQAYAQIPINGFCKFQKFKIPSNYTSLQSVNYNNDNFNDLIIYDKAYNRYVSFEGNESGFSRVRYHKIPFEISKFKRIKTSDKEGKYYVYVSRKSRSIGIINFSKYGKIKIDKILNFNSYPENLSIADINSDGISEILVSGSAFEGLSIIYQNWHGLDEKKLLNKNTFDKSFFVDINYDGSEDIAAYNSVERSIYFFLNDGYGRINLSRTLPINDNVTSLKFSDLDSDGFNDIIYTKDNSFKVIWGDSVSSFDSTSEFYTSKIPGSFLLGDYNLDGKVDLAYLDREKSTVAILFSKGKRKFYSEILYLNAYNISDLINFSNGINNGIITLTKKGEIYYLSTLTSFNDEGHILIGGEPTVLSKFDFKNDGILDIAFIDRTNNNINFLLRGNSKSPVSFYSYPLFETHKNIFVDDSDPYIKTFYFYSHNKKVIEILKINFLEFGISRNSLYSPGKIVSVKLNLDKFGNEKIYIAYLKNLSLGININFIQDIRILSSDYTDLADSVLDAKIIYADTLGVYFWQQKRDKLLLKEISMKNITPLPIVKYSSDVNTTSININSDNVILKNNSFRFYSIINKDGKYFLIKSTKDTTTVFSSSNTGNIKISNNDSFFLGQWNSIRYDNIFMYSQSKKELFRLFIDLDSHTFEFFSVLKSVDGDHFFTDYSASFYNNLFYIDKKNKSISIKRINSYEKN